MAPVLLDFPELCPSVITVCVAVTVVIVEPFVTTTAVVVTMLVVRAWLVGTSLFEDTAADVGGAEEGGGVLVVDSELLVGVVDELVVDGGVVVVVVVELVVLSVEEVEDSVGSGVVVMGTGSVSDAVRVGVTRLNSQGGYREFRSLHTLSPQEVQKLFLLKSVGHFCYLNERRGREWNERFEVVNGNTAQVCPVPVPTPAVSRGLLIYCATPPASNLVLPPPSRPTDDMQNSSRLNEPSETVIDEISKALVSAVGEANKWNFRLRW